MKKIKAYESEETFSYSFLGDGEINAQTLTESLKSIVNLLQITSAHYNPDAFVNLKVSAIKQGSFQVDLRALVEGVSFLMAFGVAEYAGSLVTALGVFLDLKRFLAGDTPKKVIDKSTHVEITNSFGDVQVFTDVGAVKQFLTNPSVDKSISDLFDVAKADQTTGFVFKHNQREIAIQANEYQAMAKYVITKSIIEPHEQRFTVELGVRKPDLGGNSQWIVYGLGHSFAIKIEDSQWLDSVHSGEVMLANGMQIKVCLRIETDLDLDGNIIEGSERYYAEEVFEVITPKRPKDEGQTRLADN